MCKQLFYIELHKELIMLDYHCSSTGFVYNKLEVQIHVRLLFILTCD